MDEKLNFNADSFSPSAICASFLGGITRAGDFKSSRQGLKNKIVRRFASVVFISYSFIGMIRKESLTIKMTSSLLL
jgi:hypothetical protein